MKIFYILVFVPWLMVSSPTFSYGQSRQDEEVCNATCRKMQEIKERSPYVVLIQAVKPGSVEASLGTGVILEHGGVFYTLTNNHVIDNPFALRVWVMFEGQGVKHEVQILGRDPHIDLALLSAPLLPHGVGAATPGVSLRVGQQVYTLGYPLGERTVTTGYVNALFWPFARTQAPLNPGSSGGPLFNEKREVVGINTAVSNPLTVAGGSISLVIPIEYVKMTIPRLIRERIVRRASTGFVIVDSSHLLPTFFDQHGLPQPSENVVVIWAVQPGSSAERAGIRPGDIISHLNGVEVSGAKDLAMKIFFHHRPDEEVRFTTRRGGTVFERRIVLQENTLSPSSKSKSE